MKLRTEMKSMIIVKKSIISDFQLIPVRLDRISMIFSLQPVVQSSIDRLRQSQSSEIFLLKTRAFYLCLK